MCVWMGEWDWKVGLLVVKQYISIPYLSLTILTQATERAFCA